MKRSADGEHRWVYTLFPTNAYASDAEMSLAEFEDFYYGACLADADDPLAAWEEASRETRRLAEHVTGHVRGPHHRRGHGHPPRRRGAHLHPLLRRSQHARRRVLHRPRRGRGRRASSPSTSPRWSRAARYRASASGSRPGKIVDATAERGEEFLIELIDTDEGARRLGELGIGTNYRIDRGTRDVLLDEKIGGTVHMAVGAAYPESGGQERERRSHRPRLRPPEGRPDRDRRRASPGGRRLQALERTGASRATHLLWSLRWDSSCRISRRRNCYLADRRRAGLCADHDTYGDRRLRLRRRAALGLRDSAGHARLPGHGAARSRAGGERGHRLARASASSTRIR